MASDLLLCTMGFMSCEGSGVSTIRTVSLLFDAHCTSVVLGIRSAIMNRLSWLSLVVMEFLSQVSEKRWRRVCSWADNTIRCRLRGKQWGLEWNERWRLLLLSLRRVLCSDPT